MRPHPNKKIAEKRGRAWRKKLVEGKLQASLHPSKLKLRRVEMGYSQAHLAGFACVSIANYGAIERGARPVKESRASSLASALKSTVKELFAAHPTLKGKLLAIR